MVPDWLWQNIAANLIADGLVATAWLTWKYRKEIMDKLGPAPPTQTIYAGSIPSEESFGDATVTVGSERRALWNVEAPTPSLAKRLTDEGIELLSWYLRQA